MKKNSLFIALAALAFVACAEKEEDLGGGVTPETPGVERTTLFAVMEDVQAKASVDIDGKTGWVSGDQVAVYTSAEKFETLTLETMVDGVATFTGSIEGTFNSGDLAIYPAAAAKAYAADKLTVTYPDTYAYSAGCLNTPMIAKVAKAEDEPVSFSHLGGAMSMTFSNVPEWAVKFVFESADKAVTGDYEVVGLEPGTATVSAVAGTTNNKVSFTFAKSTKEMTFVVPLPLGTYNKFSVWFEDAEGNEIDGSKVTVDEDGEINKVVRKAMVDMPDKAYEPWFTVNWVFGDAEIALPAFRTQIPAIDNEGNAYITSSGTQIHKVNKDGELQWSLTFDNWNGLSRLETSPALNRDGSAVYAVAGNGTEGGLYAVSSGGQILWNVTGEKFVGGALEMTQGRIAVGLNGNIFVAAKKGGLCCFDAQTGDRKSYVASDVEGTVPATEWNEGPVLAKNGGIAAVASTGMFGANATEMETASQSDYNHETNGRYTPYGFRSCYRGWEQMARGSMCILKSLEDKTYFVQFAPYAGGDDKGWQIHPTFTETSKARQFTQENLASTNHKWSWLYKDCYNDEGGIVVGENGEAIFSKKSKTHASNGFVSKPGIEAVLPVETTNNTSIDTYYEYASQNDISGSCAVDNNGFIHMIDSKANYIIVQPDINTKSCRLVAEVNVFDLVKNAGMLPDSDLVSAATWTSVKLGSDGRIYLNINMWRSGSFAYGATVCMSFKGTTSPSLVSSWPQEQADPMNSGLQVR